MLIYCLGIDRGGKGIGDKAGKRKERRREEKDGTEWI